MSHADFCDPYCSNWFKISRFPTLSKECPRQKDGKILANGGRVLNIVAKANSFKAARSNAYKAINSIDWKEGFVRHDIAKKVEEKCIDNKSKCVIL